MNDDYLVYFPIQASSRIL